LRAWLARFAGRDDGRVRAWRAVPAGGTWAEELAAAGVTAHVAEPAGTAFAPRPQAARQDRQDRLPGIFGCCWSRAGLPECWIPPAQILECRALLEAYHDLRREHTAWIERIHAVFFHQGRAAAGARARCAPIAALAALREAAAVHLSPAGQLQVATALDMLAAVEARMEVLRQQLLHAAPAPGPAPGRCRRGCMASGRWPAWR